MSEEPQPTPLKGVKLGVVIPQTDLAASISPFAEAHHTDAKSDNPVYHPIRESKITDDDAQKMRWAVFDPLDNIQTVTTRWFILREQVVAGGISLGKLDDNLGLLASAGAANSAVGGILLGATGLLSALFGWDAFKKLRAAHWNSDPRNVASLLFQDISKDDSEKLQERMNLLNNYLKTLTTKKPYCDKYASMQFVIDPQDNEIGLVFNKKAQAEKKSEEKAEKDKPMSLVSQLLSDRIYQEVIFGMTWFGFWFWILFVSSVTITGSLHWITSLSSGASYGIMAALLLPLIIRNVLKFHNWRYEQNLPKNTLNEDDQKELLNILRRSLTHVRYELPNQKLTTKIENAKYILQINNAQLSEENRIIVTEPRLNAEAQAAHHKDFQHAKLLDSLVAHSNKKLVLAAIGGFVGYYSIQQYFWIAPEMLFDTSFDPGDKKILNQETMYYLAAVMLVVALAHAWNEYEKKKRELKTWADEVRTTKQENQETLVRMDHQRDVLNHLKEEAEQVVQERKRGGIQAPEGADLTFLLSSDDYIRGGGAANIGLIPHSSTAPPGYLNEAAYDDDVRRNGPSKNRRKKKVAIRAWIGFMALVTAVTQLRFWTVEGTGALPFFNKVDFPGLSQHWAFWHAFLLSASLVATFWIVAKIWDYDTARANRRIKLFMDQLDERDETLGNQVTHCSKQIYLAKLENAIAKTKAQISRQNWEAVATIKTPPVHENGHPATYNGQRNPPKYFGTGSPLTGSSNASPPTTTDTASTGRPGDQSEIDGIDGIDERTPFLGMA